MDVLLQLQQLGYEFCLSGSDIQLSWQGQGKPNPAIAKPLIDKLKEHKTEAVRYLTKLQRMAELQLTELPCAVCPAGAEWVVGQVRGFYCFSRALFEGRSGKPPLCQEAVKNCKYKIKYLN